MKELSIEEKAKRYDEAIEIAKEINNEQQAQPFNVMTRVFPELKEGGERIELLNYLYEVHDDDEERAGWIAWIEKQCEEIDLANREYWRGYREGKQEILDKYANLEKQGEQPQGKSAIEAVKEEKVDNQNCVKPVNNVEPKFKVGDWIIHNKNIKLANSLMLVTGKDNNEYLCKDVNGQCFYNIEFIDKDYHLWTIQDAKDGDVLFTSSTASYETFIFKSIDESGNAECYFAYDSEDGFREGKYHFIGSAINCKPATKEQRDLLFQKMREAGYKWDAAKKELKKIEQKSAAWSEEDRDYYDAIIAKLEVTQEDALLTDNQMEFLKSLKDRSLQQPQKK